MTEPEDTLKILSCNSYSLKVEESRRIIGSSSQSKNRKPCNCTKSHCLKLYCECFSQGITCANCNCNNCLNNVNHEDDRRRAIKSILERNPMAFHSKIVIGDRKHSKGCNCKRSGCLKNYCECFEVILFLYVYFFRLKLIVQIDVDVRTAKTTRSIIMFNNFRPGSLLYYSDLSHPYSDTCLRFRYMPYFHLDSARCDCCNSLFITRQTTEDVCNCLISQLIHPPHQVLDCESLERRVLEEFGRCLSKFVDTYSKVCYNVLKYILRGFLFESNILV
ncbi:unnamed protein product [Protopolystoma xenopodis]|uniref:CRC domain-containing protein n=1 Tax=Protopolystoma xenopodis TaxID=117903 RepID=A0A448WA58_9PLAT|nr:unnamed protein product [Protopolystoma xenopodis]